MSWKLEAYIGNEAPGYRGENKIEKSRRQKEIAPIEKSSGLNA
jgi:hypothetical protein